ncbi:hypothetical protein ACTFIR_002449 [Dictyostelium discoideum]
MNILFLKVWRNIVIREIILYHLRLFKRNYIFKINNVKGFNNKKNKYYVQKIEINFNVELKEDIFSKYLNLTFLKFSNKFNKSIDNLTLTNNIKFIEFGNSFNQSLKPLDQLFQPNNSLESIKFGNNFNQKLIFNNSNNNIENQSILFTHFKTLKFGIYFNKPLFNIPNSIINLEFGREFNQDFSFSSNNGGGDGGDGEQSNLKCLKFVGRFNKILKVGQLPLSLKILYLSDQFNMKLFKGMLPEGLEELYFQSSYNQELKPNESIPSTVKLIKLSYSFNQELSVGVFPPNIETIIFGELFSKPIKIGIIPGSVKNLKLPKIYKTYLTNLPQPPAISELYSIPPNSYKNLSFYEN